MSTPRLTARSADELTPSGVQRQLGPARDPRTRRPRHAAGLPCRSIRSAIHTLMTA